MAAPLFAAVVLVVGLASLRSTKLGKRILGRKSKKVLVILTSHGDLGSTGQKTGFYLEELATPYYIFKDEGYDVVLASPKGGKPPMDPKSAEEENGSSSTKRFMSDSDVSKTLQSTVPLSAINPSEFDGLFFPGGHGPLWDLADDPNVLRLIETFSREGKPIAAVCHGPAVFKNAPSVVKGCNITGFTDSEEKGVKLDTVVPFSLEKMLNDYGAKFSCAKDWEPHVVTDRDGLLITGQNPASSKGVAEALVEILG